MAGGGISADKKETRLADTLLYVGQRNEKLLVNISNLCVSLLSILRSLVSFANGISPLRASVKPSTPKNPSPSLHLLRSHYPLPASYKLHRQPIRHPLLLKEATPPKLGAQQNPTPKACSTALAESRSCLRSHWYNTHTLRLSYESFEIRTPTLSPWKE